GVALCLFFQAEDGIRDWSVTGVQTCALPIFGSTSETSTEMRKYTRDLYGRLEAETGQSTGLRQCGFIEVAADADRLEEFRRVAGVGRAAGRERGGRAGGGVAMKRRERVTWGQ